MDNQCKKCTKCLETLDYSQYSKDKTNKDGLSYQCKKCKDTATKLRRLKRKETVKEIPSEKTCYCCNNKKSSNYFSKLTNNNDGLDNYCKDCSKQKNKEKKNRVKTPVIIDETITKVCRVCNNEKKLSEYRVTRKSSDNFNHICIECTPKGTWNKEKEKASQKKYRMNNPEKMKDKYRKQGKNINRRVRDSLNHRISEALFTKKVTKRNKTFEYVGCDIEFFRKWIEHQFIKDMSWENYGNWHLDHVKPCCSFDLSKEDDVKKCFSWKNIQPLWANDNIIKNNKIDIHLIESQKNKANNYENKLITI